MNESQARPPPGAAGTDQSPAGGDHPARGVRRRPGAGFRDALERRARGTSSGDATPDAASAAAMAGWFRSEPSRIGGDDGAAGRAVGAPAVSNARAVDRILIGAGPDGAEARIRIGAGALAGTEIQLSGGAGGHVVEARLLTHAATSRQTLSVVMDEIRSRLRDRGIVLSVRAPGTRPAAAPPGAGTDAGDGPLSRGRTGTGR